MPRKLLELVLWPMLGVGTEMAGCARSSAACPEQFTSSRQCHVAAVYSRAQASCSLLWYKTEAIKMSPNMCIFDCHYGLNVECHHRLTFEHLVPDGQVMF